MIDLGCIAILLFTVEIKDIEMLGASSTMQNINGHQRQPCYRCMDSSSFLKFYCNEKILVMSNVHTE